MIHYIGYYMTADEACRKKYSGNIPGRLKMEYVARCLKEASGHKIKVLSLCFSSKGFLKKTRCETEDMTLTHIASFQNSGAANKLLNRILLYLQLFFYLLRTNKKDTVVIYHSVRITRAIKKLSKLIKRNYINEIEEIYSYAADGTAKNVADEIRDLKHFDKYIVVNDTLPEAIGIAHKPYCVCYGVYQPLQRTCPRLQDKIHIVYAGTIETKKQGALTAISIAKYLSENYCLHIAGFGSDSAIENLKQYIAESNAQNRCQIVFHGYLTGSELDTLYWQSHIGLSTYVMESNFSNCSFPSKLTSYTAHDLAVVVCGQEAYRRSKLANNWLYFDELDPQKIAALISESTVDFDFSNKENMTQLHGDFVKDLTALMSSQN